MGESYEDLIDAVAECERKVRRTFKAANDAQRENDAAVEECHAAKRKLNQAIQNRIDEGMGDGEEATDKKPTA